MSRAITNGRLPKDPNGVYFVLTSSNVSENSGFCTRYCGWHTRATVGGTDIKYSFVGNPDRCPNACEEQTASPNGDSGADGMKVDTAGRLYVATRMGIQVCDQAGRVNCIVPTPNGRVSNLEFGGADFSTLFATCGDKVFKRKMKVQGATAFRAPQKPAAPHR